MSIFGKVHTALATKSGHRKIGRLLKLLRLTILLLIGRGRIRYNLKDGNKFVAFKKNRLSQEIYFAGAYEVVESAIMSRVLMPGDVMLDIGANIGYFSSIASRRVGALGQVYAFEPGEKTFAELTQSLSLLKCRNVTSERIAVSDRNGTAFFSESLDGNDAQQGLLKQVGLVGTTQSVLVKTVTLDSFLGDLSKLEHSNLKIIKCDVEGAEVRVLTGSQKILRSKNAPFWLLEYNRQALYENRATLEDILSYFLDCEIYYTSLVWPPSSTYWKPGRKIRSSDKIIPPECNLFVIPPNRIEDPAIKYLRSKGFLVE